jgi:hypothetical protein
MNAEPLLNRVAKVFAQHQLEVVMVGNAAAALHGAPVTTLDIDFMFRKTPLNMKKLKAVAHSMRAVILRPYYPVSDLFRVVNDEQGIFLNFVARTSGSRQLKAVRSRCESMKFGECELDVASRVDVERIRQTEDTALDRERENALVEQIRRLLALPMNKRTNFLRVRRPGGGSHL